MTVETVITHDQSLWGPEDEPIKVREEYDRLRTGGMPVKPDPDDDVQADSDGYQGQGC
jgi:hypothetical protein